jgi:hypothetical protein
MAQVLALTLISKQRIAVHCDAVHCINVCFEAQFRSTSIQEHIHQCSHINRVRSGPKIALSSNMHKLSKLVGNHNHTSRFNDISVMQC